MMISGILIFTKAGLAEEVAKKVAEFEGVEVHHVLEGCKIVISLEVDSIDQSYKTGKALEKIPGVLGVNVVYYNMEEAKETTDWGNAEL
ncbi:chaperone NapD [Calidifontibacillus oryziterrae]|uniref:chaperone NapD n=1 Tax=Calidifontibacillus oryziterrae TaxID=1191699 RepID=UPI0002DF5DF3|nr:chaperone NapD [Calidifontibacillus oryziterrae]